MRSIIYTAPAAAARYLTVKIRKRYLIGKISVTELQLAVREMDEARRQYVSGLLVSL